MIDKQVFAQALKDKGLTISSLAKEIGLSRQTISYIANGHTSPSLETMALIANRLERKIDFFLSKKYSASDDV